MINGSLKIQIILDRSEDVITLTGIFDANWGLRSEQIFALEKIKFSCVIQCNPNQKDFGRSRSEWVISV